MRGCSFLAQAQHGKAEWYLTTKKQGAERISTTLCETPLTAWNGVPLSSILTSREVRRQLYELFRPRMASFLNSPGVSAPWNATIGHPVSTTAF